MKTVFLACRSQSETPQRIEQRLTEDGLKIIHNQPTGPYLVIRWGISTNPNLDANAKAVLNSAKSISDNVNKLKAHRLMRNAGVSTPKFWTAWSEAKSEALALGCDVLRRRLNHSQGKDILRLSPTDNLERKRRSGYYVQFLAKEAEFRVHVFRGACIGLAEKKPISPAANPDIWNTENGYEMIYHDPDERTAISQYPAMLNEATKAAKALGLDFGACDIIISDSKPYVLEINSAPKLNKTQRYAKSMERWVNENE